MNIEDSIRAALIIAGITDYDDAFTALGGGEVNNTFKISAAGQQLIIRIAKDKNQDTLKDEARSLRLLDSPRIPRLVYFDEKRPINDRMWILESYVAGSTVERLSEQQFHSLGALLARVHQQQSSSVGVKLQEQFLDSCKSFGDEKYLLDHPDVNLRQLIRAMWNELAQLQPVYDTVPLSLTHSDATPSNILVDGGEVSLIDWEFSKYSDPMFEFSTVYYEDIEYNKGKWRIQITDNEKQALFDGYTSDGGHIDEVRIKFWIRFDKLTAAIFLHWRINHSERATSDEEFSQYKADYKKPS